MDDLFHLPIVHRKFSFVLLLLPEGQHLGSSLTFIKGVYTRQKYPKTGMKNRVKYPYTAKMCKRLRDAVLQQ